MSLTLITCLLLAAPDPAVEALILAEARVHLPADAAGLKVVKLSVPAGFASRVAEGSARVDFRRDEDFSGSTLVRLVVDGHGRWVSVDFELLLPTAVARTNMVRGHVLSAEDIDIQPRPRRLQRGQAPVAPGSLVGRVLLTGVKAGELLLSNHLRRPTVIRRGDRVVVIVTGENLVLRSNGVAQAAGRVGDSIPVKNQRSNKRIVGVVTGPGQVRIPLDSGGLR